MQRRTQFVSISLAVVILVAGIIAASALIGQYQMMAFNLDEVMSVPTGIAETGFEPVTISGYLKKKTTFKKKATVWKKKAQLDPWMTELLPGLDPNQDNWANDIAMYYFGPGSDPFFEAAGAAVTPAGVQKPMRWTHEEGGPWMMDPLPLMDVDAEGEVLGVWHLPPNWDIAVDGDYLYSGWQMLDGATRQAVVWSEIAGVKSITPVADVPAGDSWGNDGLVSSTDMAYLIGGVDDVGMTYPMLWTWMVASGPANAMASPLPLLPGGQQGEAMVVVINAAVLIAGWSENSDGVMRPVSWMMDNGNWMVDDIGVIAGDDGGMVLGGIYHMGEISLVGTSMDNLGKAKRGALWHKVTPSPSWTLTDLAQATLAHKVMPETATGVDAMGRIVGYGMILPSPGAAITPADSDYAFVLTPDPATDAGDSPAPRALGVETYPNPFNPSVTVEITPARAGPATVTVHDVNGRYVTTLFDGRLKAAAPRRLTWDGTSAAGGTLASGVYFVRVQSAGQVASRRVVLLK